VNDSDARSLAIWIKDRFLPAYLKIKGQALTINQIIAGQAREPADFVRALVEPQPLLDELASVPGPQDAVMRKSAQAFLSAWKRIRGASVTGKPIADGAKQFQVMLDCATYFDNLIANSLRDETDYIQ
jgi:hypothetical protein